MTLRWSGNLRSPVAAGCTGLRRIHLVIKARSNEPRLAFAANSDACFAAESWAMAAAAAEDEDEEEVVAIVVVERSPHRYRQ